MSAVGPNSDFGPRNRTDVRLGKLDVVGRFSGNQEPCKVVVRTSVEIPLVGREQVNTEFFCTLACSAFLLGPDSPIIDVLKPTRCKL